MSDRSGQVLVGCEFSGRVRNALLIHGYPAVSCDLLDSETPGPHIRGDVLDHLNDGWGGLLGFPPCTYIAASGARWMKERLEKQREALKFFRALLDAPVPKRAVENPVGVASTQVRKPDQIVQPWMFGTPETKATCLWEVGLPRLVPTNVNLQTTLEQRNIGRVHHEVPSPDRWKNRSRTDPGLADAMAVQWGPKMVKRVRFQVAYLQAKPIP